MPGQPTDRDLDGLLADLGLVGPDSRLQRVVRLAAYGVIRRSSKVLLCRVAPGYRAVGKWTLPGGGLDFGEPPELAVVREVEEETGLVGRITGSPAILSDTGHWNNGDDLVPYHRVRFVYPMDVVGGAERVEVDGSTDAVGWFTEGELADLRIVSLVRLALGISVRAGEERPAEDVPAS